MHYVGDWHTHPQAVPEPSIGDVESIGDCFRRSTKAIGGFLLVVVGREPFPLGLFVGLHDGTLLHRLEAK